MIARDLSGDPLDRTRYPLNEWGFAENSPPTGADGAMESIFAVGNGYLGMRGTPEEGIEAQQQGTFVNGFHETWTIHHAEAAYGFARTGQTIINAPDTKLIKLYVDDEPLVVNTAELLDYSRELDFREGVLKRSLLWRTPSGKSVRVDSTRMVSFEDRHLALMTFDVTVLDANAPVVISSQMLNRQDTKDEPRAAMGEAAFDPRKASHFDERVLEPKVEWNSERRMILGYRAHRSGMTIAVGSDHFLDTENAVEVIRSTEADRGKQVFRIRAKAGVPIRLIKSVAYHTSHSVPTGELVDRCRRTLDRFRESDVAEAHANQRAWLDDFWATSDVRIEGQPAIQQATRWCIFQLAQATARADQLGIAAKGVTGSGYEGHAFWDTEVYVLPFLAYSNPGIARNALRFRVNLLESARERAREMSQRGALFPWRTINGEEASAYYAAGTAQYHINADIAHAFTTYTQVTGDWDFMYREGAQVLAETARMYADLGFWRTNGDATFHIHGVTGPDEYTTVVNNNLFTNVMARHNLASAADVLEVMRREVPDLAAALMTRLNITDDEIAEWRACADHMYIPFDEAFGIHPQDEHFLEREVWDLAQTPDDMRPLLLHYHPLVIYRFQVIKQADVVLALFLQGHEFTADQKKRDFDYYDPITTGDSTLSAVVQSIIASEVGYDELALAYFRNGLFVDLADLHRNTVDGVHIASAGGVWNSLVFGFGGLREFEGNLSFDPRLPRQWTSLEFPLQVRGNSMLVRLEQESLTLTLTGGKPFEVTVRGETVKVGKRKTVVKLTDQGPRIPFDAVPVWGEGTRADGTIVTAGVPDPERPWQSERVRPTP